MKNRLKGFSEVYTTEDKTTLSYHCSKLDNGGVLGIFTKHDILSTNHMLIEMVKEKTFFLTVAQNYTMMEFWRLYKN